MKLHHLDVHDRYKSFLSDDQSITACCQDLINQRPFGNHAFYIFAHGRTDDDGVTKRIIWQPRLTKPLAQTNSMLFKAYPGTDIIKIIWILPPKEQWGQYAKGLMLENQTVTESVYLFEYDRNKLEEPEDDDLSDETISQIYVDIATQGKMNG